jgi:quercetin 2,3-dioxygenase
MLHAQASLCAAFWGVDLAVLDLFVHLDQMGEVDCAPGEPKGTPWHPT